jgi:hypothetical protein
MAITPPPASFSSTAPSPATTRASASGNDVFIGGDGGAYGGGVFFNYFAGTTQFINTIIAGNSADSTSADLVSFPSGSITGHHNLIGDGDIGDANDLLVGGTGSDRLFAKPATTFCWRAISTSTSSMPRTENRCRTTRKSMLLTGLTGCWRS